jgi:hypothetical protein
MVYTRVKFRPLETITSKNLMYQHVPVAWRLLQAIQAAVQSQYSMLVVITVAELITRGRLYVDLFL